MGARLRGLCRRFLGCLLHVRSSLMLQVSPWFSVISLLVSIASFALSFHVMRSNGKFLLAKTRSDLLTKIQETRSRYNELNQRYRTLTARSKQISAQNIASLAAFSQFEKNTERYYEKVQEKNYNVTVLEGMRHHIESMLIHIASDMKRLDEWEQKLDESSGKNS